MTDPNLEPRSPFCRPASAVSARPLEWLWTGRLALGKLAILDGDPGLGKSLVALDLCARLSTGATMPDRSAGPGAYPSLILNGEDGAEDTIRPRLELLGADMGRILIAGRLVDSREPFHLPAHLDVLDETVAQSSARLVVIDPVTAFLDPGVNLNDDPAVRRALLPVAHLAEQRRCLVLMVRHLNKEGGSMAIYRGGGSIGIAHACRSAWLVAADPLGGNGRVLAQVKNNLAEAQPSLAFAVRRRDDGRGGLTWKGPCEWSAEQLLAEAKRAADLASRERARMFLTQYLADGPACCRDLWRLAQRRRLSVRTLRRVKTEMSIRSVRAWAGGQRLSYWLLPGQKLPEGVAPETVDDDLEDILGPIAFKYPPPTPLDDL